MAGKIFPPEKRPMGIMFGKKKSKEQISGEEVSEGLRSKYRSAAREYGERYFNLADLENRIRTMMKGGMEPVKFLAQEMDFFLRAEKLALSHRQKNENVRKANAVIDQILEEHARKIEAYPDLFFHPKASYEMRKLVGGMQPLITAASGVCYANPESRSALIELERFAVKDEKPSLFLLHYAEQISVLPPLEGKRHEQRIMQTAAVAIAVIRKQCIILEKEKGIDLSAIQKIVSSADALLEDFRLSSLAFSVVR